MDYRNDGVENGRGRGQQGMSGEQPVRRYPQGGYQQRGASYGESQQGSHQQGGSSYEGQQRGGPVYGNRQPESPVYGSRQPESPVYGSRMESGQYQRSQVHSGQTHNSQQRAVSQTAASRQYKNQQEIAKARAVSKRREELEKLRRERDRSKRLKRRIIIMIVAECFTLAAIFGYAYFARRISLMPRPDVDKKNVINDDLQVADLEKMKGYWMIAVFGVDSRNGSVGAGNQSDVNMICCINQDTGEIRLVSVFRDTYLNTNDGGRYSKFNEAYARGGPEQALKFLNKNLDLNITDYITFSWKAVAEGINLLGGVDLEISKAEFRYINGFITETVKGTNLGSTQLKSAGMNHLDGVQAVAYGRLRLMDTDYARTERQRKIIELAFDKAKKADYATLNNILVTVLPQVSHNLDFVDLTNVALSISKYHIGETAGFPFARDTAVIPGKGDCVIPQTLESNVSELHTFLFGDDGYQPTETVKQISSKISSDTGMYKQGKSVGHVSTEGYLPSETTKAQETRAQETTTAEETDEEGNPVEPSESSTAVTVPGIGETDENGNLVDGPETEDPDDPWNGTILPGGNDPTNPTNPISPGNPNGPGESDNQTDPNIPPGNTWNGPGDQVVGPGGNSSNQDSSVYGPGGLNNQVPGQTGSDGSGPGGPGYIEDPDTGRIMLEDGTIIGR